MENTKMRCDKGFTLIELLVAMVIAGIVMGSIYSVYYSQQKSYVAQEQVVSMQQNLRAAIYIMQREIRMAGYDPNGTAQAGIQSISNNTINFTLDITNTAGTGDPDGDCDDANEDITYSLYTADGIQKLGRKSTSTANNQPVAENIEALGFAYAFDDNGDGQLDTSGGNVIWAIDSDNNNDLDLDLDTNGDGVIDENDDADTDGMIDGTGLASDVSITNIRALRIWILARTDRTIRGYTDTNTYVVGDKVVTPSGNDRKYRRRLLTTTVKCRNMGL